MRWVQRPSRYVVGTGPGPGRRNTLKYIYGSLAETRPTNPKRRRDGTSFDDLHKQQQQQHEQELDLVVRLPLMLVCKKKEKQPKGETNVGAECARGFSFDFQQFSDSCPRLHYYISSWFLTLSPDTRLSLGSASNSVDDNGCTQFLYYISARLGYCPLPFVPSLCVCVCVCLYFLSSSTNGWDMQSQTLIWIWSLTKVPKCIYLIDHSSSWFH